MDVLTIECVLTEISVLLLLTVCECEIKLNVCFIQNVILVLIRIHTTFHE